MATKNVNLSKAVSSKAYRILAKDLDNLKVENCRRLKDWYVPELAREIARDGQRNPGLCRVDQSGNPICFAGAHRVAAIRLINLDPEKWGVPAPLDFFYYRQDCPDGADTVIASVVDNTGEALSFLDICNAIDKLAKYGWSVDDIVNKFPAAAGKAAKLTVNRVNVSLAQWVINSLGQDIQDKLHSGELKRIHATAFQSVAKEFNLSSSELGILSDCIHKRKSECATFLGWLSRLKECDIDSKRIAFLAKAVTKSDLQDEPVTATSINRLVAGKKRSRGVESARPTADLVKLCKVVDTPMSKLVAHLLEHQGQMSDEEVIRLFRTSLVEVED